MRVKLTKSEFCAKMQKRIELRENLSQIRNGLFVELLNKFNGKVYNVRFRKALEEAINNNLIYVSEGSSISTIKIVGRIDRYNYSETEEIYINLVLNNGRIDAAATLAEQYTVIWADSFAKYTEEIRRAVEQYDEIIKAAQEIEDAIKRYSLLPHPARENITGFATYYIMH